MRPKHIEVQILGDNHGNLVHLFERDCSVQRRHQKVIEYAPAWSLPQALRARLAEDALKIARHVKLHQRRHRRVPGRRGRRRTTSSRSTRASRSSTRSPRRSPGATWCRRRSGSRRATSCPIRRSASAARTRSSSAASRSRCASPPRIRATTSCPTPGKITVYRPAVGLGIRLDDGSGYVGARVSQYYDSLLVKITASGLEWNYARRKVVRALREFRIRGVKTNLAFLENVLSHPTFAAGKAHTTFIDETPELMQYPARRDRATRILRYVGSHHRQRPPDGARQAEAADVGAVGRVGAAAGAAAAAAPGHQADPRQGRSGRHRQDAAQGPARARYTDTTWRDAHQSLLATRLRSYDIARVAPATAHLCAESVLAGDVGRRDVRRRLPLPVGGPVGAAGRAAPAGPERDVPDAGARRQRRRLHELPRRRRQRRSSRRPRPPGMDVFRIFDALNDVDNMQVAIEAAQKTGRDRRDGDLLHGRRLRSAAQEVRPQVLRRPGQGDRPAAARTCWRSRTWRAC